MALAFPKVAHTRPSWKARDAAESRIVKARSGGRCEVTIDGARCPRRAAQVHHQIGGWKRRGRGASALAEHKTHACAACHRLITGDVGIGQALAHVAGNTYQWRQALREIA